MNKPKLVFLGATSFSNHLLEDLITQNVAIKRVYTIPKDFKISYSKNSVKNYMYSDLHETAIKNDIPVTIIETNIGEKLLDFYAEIAEIKPDVILVMGWYYMVPKKIRNLAKHGAWGIHASLLPKYAGGAPLVWAIINGETKTGVTLFKLDEGVDDGDIILQKEIYINKEDTIAEVYQKATIASKEILQKIFSNSLDLLTFTPQSKESIEVWPQRSPEDGEIDWNWDVEKIKNFIRAQTKPYPGAWTIIDGKKITIWSATIEDLTHE